jgi:hypothetical protein
MSRNRGKRVGDLSSRRAQKRQLERMYEKYKGICQICFKFCARDQASRDHVVELSNGGDKSDDNVILAHELCNNLRSNSPTGKNPTQGISNEMWTLYIRRSIKGCLFRQKFGASPTSKDTGKLENAHCQL